jgi:hypothetical protein
MSSKYASENVTDEQMRLYLDTFKRTFRDTAEKFLAAENRAQLARYPLLDGNVVGYVSTQFGAGIEYEGGSAGQLVITRHSSPVDDMFLKAPAFVRKAGVVGFALENSSNVTLTRIRVLNARPFRFKGEISSLRIIDSDFSFGSWNRKVVLAELYGNRRSDFWSEAWAVRRATDEILVALSDVSAAAKHGLSLNESLRRFKERTVLVLGDYAAEGMARIDAICQELTKERYAPILAKDVSDLPGQDLQQKVVALGSVSRFVVVDDSTKAGQMVELVKAQENRFITIVLRKQGLQGSYMTRAASATSTVIFEAEYTDDALGQILGKALVWAEERIIALDRIYSREYPWLRPEEQTDVTGQADAPPTS